MKIYILLLIAVFTFVGCINKKERNIQSFEEFIENTTIPDEMIRIDTSFKPTIELTSEIIELSLDELIIKKYYENKNKYENKKSELAIVKFEIDLLVRQGNLTHLDFLNSNEFEKKIRAVSEILASYLDEGLIDKEMLESIRREMEYSLRPTFMNLEIEITTINKNTNVAKAYFLQDFKSFIKYNSKYYNKIIGNERQKEGKKKERERRENWEKYNAIPAE